MDEAESLYRRAVELDPWLAIAYTNLGNIRFRRHDTEGARRSIARRSRSTPGNQKRSTISATSCWTGGRCQHSLFVGAIEADPDFADAYFNLAMAYEQVGDTSGLDVLAQLHRLEPSGPGPRSPTTPVAFTETRFPDEVCRAGDTAGALGPPRGSRDRVGRRPAYRSSTRDDGSPGIHDQRVSVGRATSGWVPIARRPPPSRATRCPGAQEKSSGPCRSPG